MNVETVWSEGRQASTGLDQIGIRANSVRMYDHLVPGITNVTNRVRYYSMHAWMIHWWAKNAERHDNRAFFRKLRIFECIVGMAERIRGFDHEKDFGAVTGANTFRDWLHTLKEKNDDISVPLEELAKRYWKNSGGAFGQYYRGSARVLGVIREEGEVIGLTPEIGIPLVEAFQEATKSTDLEKMVREERATLGQLRELAQASTFEEIGGRESILLRGLLLDETRILGESGDRRRNTLLTVLSLAAQTDNGLDENPLPQIFDAALHGRTANRTKFLVPSILQEQVKMWRLYALQECLASGLETLLSVAVDTVGQNEGGNEFSTIGEVSAAAAQKLPKDLGREKWGDLVKRCKDAYRWQTIDPETDNFDEWRLRMAGVNNVQSSAGQSLAQMLCLLARLTMHIQGEDPYEIFRRTGMKVMPMRISMLEWIRFVESRDKARCEELLADVIEWALCNHLRLAGLKLIFTKIYTYKIAFFDSRLTMVGRLDPALSQPRLLQAVRMLTDVGLLKWNEQRIVISKDGLEVLERHGCL